ncbi:unnamed protein product, partial [Rotaria magnacalcarata]
KEKLSALDSVEKNLGNKQLTAHQHGCSRYQLSQWLKGKMELETLSKLKHEQGEKIQILAEYFTVYFKN